MGKIVDWKLARKCNFESGGNWYEHEPESVLQNKDYKILWDFSIKTDHVIEAWKPDLVVADKRRTCKTIDLRSKKGVTEGLECESEDYIISSELFGC